MSDLITLEDGKKHLQVIHDDEDVLIKFLIDAAIDHVSMWIDRPLNGTDAVPVLLNGATPPSVTGLKPSLYAAGLLILGDLYANRESNITDIRLTVSPTLERLMWPYRRMGV